MSEEKIRPWLQGIVDTLVGANLIRQSKIPHRNRLAVILIDSAFETACRAFLQNKAKVALKENHRHRENLINTVKSKLSDVDDEVWDSINYYYTDIRCDFYHQSAGKTITDVALLDYQETVEFVINQAFGVKIGPLVSAESNSIELQQENSKEKPSPTPKVQLSGLNTKVDKMIVAVGTLGPKNKDEVNEFFKREGDSLRLKNGEFTKILARNSGTKKFFFYDRELRKWQLSGTGRFKFGQLQKEAENGGNSQNPGSAH
ncbi:MAG: hypothetical protein LLH30_00310 [Candidatus Manganitrophus sp. SA1]|nr:hypothetical protein [Candidatus Manganitrophus morganii]